jgi:hypothetical protein
VLLRLPEPEVVPVPAGEVLLVAPEPVEAPEPLLLLVPSALALGLVAPLTPVVLPVPAELALGLLALLVPVVELLPLVPVAPLMPVVELLPLVPVAPLVLPDTPWQGATVGDVVAPPVGEMVTPATLQLRGMRCSMIST